MFTEHYNSKLMKNFRKTFFAYMPSKEMETISYNPKPLSKEEEEDIKSKIAKCYDGSLPVYKKPADAANLRKTKKRQKTPSNESAKKILLSFGGADTKRYSTWITTFSPSNILNPQSSGYVKPPNPDRIEWKWREKPLAIFVYSKNKNETRKSNKSR